MNPSMNRGCSSAGACAIAARSSRALSRRRLDASRPVGELLCDLGRRRRGAASGREAPLMPLSPVRTDDVQGRTLRCSRFGQGPPIVFLHGYPDNLHMWSAVGPLLADSFEVIAIDWPGRAAAPPGRRRHAVRHDSAPDRRCWTGRSIARRSSASTWAVNPRPSQRPAILSASSSSADRSSSSTHARPGRSTCCVAFSSINSFSATHRGSSSGAHGRPPSAVHQIDETVVQVSRTASAKTQCVSSSSGCARDTREPCRVSSRMPEDRGSYARTLG